jgi:deoxyribonuclease V
MSSGGHAWRVSPRRAVRIQKDLRARLMLTNGFDVIRIVAGADVAYSRRLNRVYAAVAAFDYATMDLLEDVYAQGPAGFPYIPGLLTFREGPAVMKAFRRLKNRPDMVLFDGQGIAHPRRMGLASHLGILLDLPSIGCAKSPLRVQFRQPGRRRGSATRMMAGDEQVGVVLRTREGVKPVYVSPGYRVDVPTSAQIVMKCGRGCRLPEPTRRAHMLVSRYRLHSEERIERNKK